jgi:hypothetical protein
MEIYQVANMTGGGILPAYRWLTSYTRERERDWERERKRERERERERIVYSMVYILIHKGFIPIMRALPLRLQVILLISKGFTSEYHEMGVRL